MAELLVNSVAEAVRVPLHTCSATQQQIDARGMSGGNWSTAGGTESADAQRLMTRQQRQYRARRPGRCARWRPPSQSVVYADGQRMLKQHRADVDRSPRGNIGATWLTYQSASQFDVSGATTGQRPTVSAEWWRHRNKWARCSDVTARQLSAAGKANSRYDGFFLVTGSWHQLARKLSQGSRADFYRS